MTERSYDYLAKNTVRELWMRFLDPVLRYPERVRGFYLPATENLELRGYLDRGLLVPNLIGAEHDQELLQTVRASSGGLRIIGGDVQNAVVTMERERLPGLDFVNLDFDGMYDTYIQDVLSVFRLFPAGQVGTFTLTSFSSRDDEALQQGHANISKFNSALPEETQFLSEMGAMVARWRQAKRLVGSRVSDEHYLSRNLGLLWWFAVAMMVVTRSGGPYAGIDRPFLRRISKILDRLSKKVGERSRGADFVLVSEPALRALLVERKVELWPTELQHWVYYSQRGKPMHTWFLRIWRKEGDLPSAQELIEQLWQLALRAPIGSVDDRGVATTFG